MTQDEAFAFAADLRLRVGEHHERPTTPQEWRAWEDHCAQLDRERRRLAEGFGGLLDWEWVNDRRGVQHLRGRRVQWVNQVVPTHSDHSSAYRAGSKIVALVEQPYASPDKLEDMHGWASEQGLVMTIPNWPSWWFPGMTTLCLFTLPEVAPLIEAAVGHAKAGLPILQPV